MKILEPHEVRVVAERKELESKIEDLSSFIWSARFESVTETQRYLLRRQLEVMSLYAGILDDRIADFWR